MGSRSNTSAQIFKHYEPSPTQHDERYHVYLSYDRDSDDTPLVKLLRKRLSREGLDVYKESKKEDDPLLQGIENSTVYIPIFSADYASSPSWLDDLSTIWKWGFHQSTLIIPLFYDVKLSDVRYPDDQGPYAKAFQKHRENGRSEEEMAAWKDALHKISYKPGWSLVESGNGDEDRLVELIVKDLLKTFNKTPSAQSFWVCVHYICGVTDMVSVFNGGVIVLTLGNYGLQLSAPVFWLCWSILVPEAVIFSLIQPYWKWIKSAMPAQTADASEDSHRPAGRAEAVFLKLGMSLAVIALLIILEDLSKRQNKILLCVGLSSILLEGFQAMFIVKEEFQSFIRNPLRKGMQMIRSIRGQDWNAVNFIAPSVINAMIIVTGEIVLGGNLGSLMHQKSFWIFVSIVVVDLIAEAIHRFDCGNRSDSIPERKPRWHYIGVVLRLIVEGSLSCWMTKEIVQKSYLVDASACDLKCPERSESLLIAMVVLGGLQAAVTFLTLLRSCIVRPQDALQIVFTALRVIGNQFFSIIYKFLPPSTSAPRRTRVSNV